MSATPLTDTTSLSSVEPSLGVNCGMSTGRNGVVYAVDVRNGSIDPKTNGTLQSKPNGGLSLNCNNVVMVANSSGNDIAGTLDASYYKGQGGNIGRERVHRDDSKGGAG